MRTWTAASRRTRRTYLAIATCVLVTACGSDDGDDSAPATTTSREPAASATTDGNAVTTPASTATAATEVAVTSGPTPDEPWKCVDPTAEEPDPGTEFVWGFGGGTTGEHAEQYIVPAFEAATGLKIAYVGASSAETMAQVVGAGGDAGFDITMQPFAVVELGRAAGVLSEIDYAVMPELADIPVDAHDPGPGADMALAINQFGYGIAYNSDTLAANNMPEPTSIMDLFDPVYGDKVGLYSPPYSSANVQLAVVNELMGGPPDDWSAALDQFASLKDRSQRFGDHSEIVGAIADGSVGIWFDTTSIANNFKDQGLPVEMVMEPVAPVAYVFATIPTGSKDKGAAACVFLNWAMSAEGQKLFSENGKNNPVRPGVPTPEGSVMPPLDGLELLNVGPLLQSQPNVELITEQWNQAFQ